MALWAGYSYSEPYVYGVTTNVANAYTWHMPDYLPDDPVIDINAVIYSYTTVKQTEDDMLVHVQNKNALGTGYIFRETDDWSGLPSGSINKFVPVPNIDANLYGEGSIEVEGNGQVTGQRVQYNYRIDTAFTDNKDVYIPDIPVIDVYNVLDDELVSYSQAEQEPVKEEENDDKPKDEERTERALRAAKAAIGIGNTQSQQMMMAALSLNVMTSYYNVAIDGGTYKEQVELVDTKLPDSKKGLRNGLAQQVLHTKLVDMQYEDR